jgi:tetratricopeptide (TPR) repeat protein
LILHELGRLEEARRAFLDVIESREPRHFASVDRSLAGFKARQNLAVVAGDMGDLAEAERWWREVVREMPRYRPGWRGLAETLVRGGEHAAAELLAASLLGDEGIKIEGLLIRGRIARAQGRFDDVRAALDRAVAERPDDVQTLRERFQLLFERGAPEEAERALRCLIERDPLDASAYHNLGTLLMRTHRCDEAVRAYRQSLHYRADYAPTLLNLGYALNESGRAQEAVEAWEQVVRLAPGDQEARKALACAGIVPTDSGRWSGST